MRRHNTFPVSPDNLDDPSWRQEAHALVRSHISFGRDGGVSRDSVWENLADTLKETGRLAWYEVVESYFDRAWPAPRRRNSPRHEARRTIDKQLRLMSPVGRVYSVDGGAVRKKHTDFIGGGHPAVYPWMPTHEVWIERMRGGHLEERYLLAHEMAEIVLMSVRKWAYDKAHNAANVVEQRLRVGTDSAKVFHEFVVEHFPGAETNAAEALAESLSTSYEKY